MIRNDDSPSVPRVVALVALIAVALAVAAVAASADAEPPEQLLEPAYYLLEDIIHGPTWPTDRRIGTVEATSERGRIHFPVRQSSRCREIYEFSWWFDRDLERLETGERFKVNAHGVLRSADCYPNADPYFTVDGNMNTSSERIRTLGVVKDKIYKGIEGNSGNIYLKGSQQRRGPREVWLEMPDKIQYETPYVWFGVMVRAPSPVDGELVNYDLIYLYRAQFSFR